MRRIPPISPPTSPPTSPATGPRVLALAYDGLCTFEFAIVAEVFGLPRPEMGPGWYRFATAAVEPGPLRAHGGLRFEVEGGLELVDEADLVVVPGWKGVDVPVPDRLVRALRTAHARGARLASICSGAFVLAATGLLDGRRAATHWRYAQALREAHPAVDVDAEVLYVETDRVWTSAGSAAGIDLMLHLVALDFGAEAANAVARRLVVPTHRSGGQAQFIERPLPARPRGGLGPLLDRVRADPGRDWTVRRLAAEMTMSERTFLRRFAEATGRTPADWVAEVRVAEARRLLEATALPVEAVAHRAGFGSTAMLRLHFRRATGLSPREHRERFRHGPQRGSPPGARWP